MPSVISCPKCTRQLRVPDDLIGRMVKCPSCEVTFTAAAAEPPAAPPLMHEHFTAERTAPAPPREQSPAGDFDFADSGPGGDFQEIGKEAYSQRGRRLALDRASGPALALMITTGIVMGLTVLRVVVLFGMLIIAAANPPPGGARGPGNAAGPDDLLLLGGFGLLPALAMLAYNAFVFYGAMQMKQLRSHGVALAAGIMAMFPCTGCCLLTLPFGIWAITVINDPGVRPYFRS